MGFLDKVTKAASVANEAIKAFNEYAGKQMTVNARKLNDSQLEQLSRKGNTFADAELQRRGRR
jgi:hypothetical protein